jgi:hypothetical protein
MRKAMKISDETGFHLYDNNGNKFLSVGHTVRDLIGYAEHLAKRKLYTELVNSGFVRLWDRIDYRDNGEAFVLFEIKGTPSRSSCCG